MQHMLLKVWLFRSENESCHWSEPLHDEGHVQLRLWTNQWSHRKFRFFLLLHRNRNSITWLRSCDVLTVRSFQCHRMKAWTRRSLAVLPGSTSFGSVTLSVNSLSLRLMFHPPGSRLQPHVTSESQRSKVTQMKQLVVLRCFHRWSLPLHLSDISTSVPSWTERGLAWLALWWLTCRCDTRPCGLMRLWHVCYSAVNWR